MAWKWTFLAGIAGVDLAWFIFGKKIFGMSPLATFGVALLVSWIPMQLIARSFEGRWLLFDTQYKSFFIGDLVLIPAVAAGLTMLSKNLPSNKVFDSVWWLLGAIAFGIMIGFLFHQGEKGAYTASQLASPTKLFHDLVAFPVWSFLLFYRAPALFYSQSANRTAATVLVAATFAAFAYFPLFQDPKTAKDPSTYAHPSYDWKTLTAIHTPTLAQLRK